jgi:hypothetical protein
MPRKSTKARKKAEKIAAEVATWPLQRRMEFLKKQREDLEFKVAYKAVKRNNTLSLCEKQALRRQLVNEKNAKDFWTYPKPGIVIVNSDEIPWDTFEHHLTYEEMEELLS